MRCCRRLVGALLLRAIRDAQAGDEDARAWLAGEESAHWADMLELEGWPPKVAALEAAARDRRSRTEVDL